VLWCCDLEGSNMWELKLPVSAFYESYPSMTSDEYGNIYEEPVTMFHVCKYSKTTRYKLLFILLKPHFI
jgi:hypothetical protein